MSTELDYDGLVKAYYENLHTTLRNFRPGPDFLDTWVHDEDHNRSIMGIFEAAAERGGLDELSINVSTQLSDALDRNWLKQNLSDFGAVSIQDAPQGLKVNLHFSAKKTVESVHPAYQRELGARSRKIAFEGTIDIKSNPRGFESTVDGVTLSVLLNEKNVVTEAKHTGTRGVYRPLIDVLCEVLVNAPIQEGSEHACIRVEQQLRNISVPPPVAGLVTPNNADPIFQLPLALIRDIYRQAQEKVGVKTVLNRFDVPISASWDSLSPEQRNQKIHDVLQEICTELHFSYPKIEVLEVKNDSRVYLSAHEYMPQKDFGHNLLVLERELKRRLEPRLELNLEGLEDRNKREARTKRDPLPAT